MAFLWSKLLMLLLVIFASGKPFEGEKKKVEKLMASDEPPHARSDLEAPGRILDLGNDRESDSNNDGDPDDGNTQSSLDEPTSTPFEEQAKNSDNSEEVMSPGNPTMAPAEEPKEDKETKPEKMITSAETESESTNIEPAQSMATLTSTVTKVAPTKHEEFSMPTEPSSTPEPLSAEQEKLSMPTEPSSTPAPLPTPAESPVERSTSPPALTPTKPDVEMKENEKLSTPTTPSSTPAPLPTEQASPTVENPVASPTTSTALTPTKSDAKKPEASSKLKPSAAATPTNSVTAKAAPTPKIVSQTTPSLFSALLKKHAPTMPVKELPDMPNRNRRSNITDVKTDPFKDFDDKTNMKKSQADPFKDVVDKTDKKKSHKDPLKDFSDKTNKKNSHTDDPFGVFDDKTKKKKSHSDDPFGLFDDKTNKKKSHSAETFKEIDDKTKKKTSHSNDPLGVFDDKTNKQKSQTDPLKKLNDNTNKKNSHSDDPFGVFDDKTNKKKSRTADPFEEFDDKTKKKKSYSADPFEEFDDKTKKKKSYSADPFEEFDDKTNKKTSHEENTIQGSKKDSTQDSMIRATLSNQSDGNETAMQENKLFNQSDSNETAMQEAVFNQSDSSETAKQEDKLFDQSESEEPVEARDSSDHSGDAAVKEPVIAKPIPVEAVKPVKPVKPVNLVKPVKPVYSRTQPASFVLRKECKARVDLTFLLDGSQDIGKMRFERSLQFVKDLVKSFRVSKDDAHVSMVVCSQKPHVVFDLNAFSDHDSIERAMGSITYPGGKMFAGGCLKTIKTGIFENSGRHGVPKLLYFMSSGKSNDHVSLPSRALRDLGVQVFSLGLGTKYNARELKEVATAPYYDHVLATRYEILDLLRPYVTAQLCRGSGGKLVSRDADKVPKKKQNELKAKSVITPSKTEDGFRKSMLSELKEKEKKKKAALKADIRKKLHILLSKLGRKFHDEKAIYRSIIYNINGHRDAGCKDYHILCKTWGKKGYCKKSSAKHGIDAYSVQRVCPKTCVVCYQ